MSILKTSEESYFFWMAILGLAAVLIGFSKTFIAPMCKGSFSALIIVFIHAAFAFSWILLFIIQTTLINLKKYKAHILIGTFGIAIAFGAAITMLPAGIYAVEKELAQGLGETAISGLLGTITSAIIFLSLVTAGILNRKNPATHKRLMLLATIVLLWPAWFRFRHYFPSVERPDIWFAVVLSDSLIILSCIWDKMVNKRIHNVFLYVGLFIILEHIFEVIYFDSPTWRTIAKQAYDFLN